ncbi:MAG: response regulator [Candidatus Omnitrophica bacterium]|nr:response regulator [Candidatus Omnitrophota bacterium]
MKKKILTVDDEPDMLEILEVILSRAGYEVIQASNGQDAVIMAKEQKPDLIILDIKMPGMDGGRATDILKNYRQTRDIPIIYLSSLVNAQEVEEDGHVLGSKIGDMYFVSKSASPEELLEVVKKNIGPGFSS